MRIVVTLVTSLLPQVLVFQVVLQGGNGNKGKKLYVESSRARTLLLYYYFVIDLLRKSILERFLPEHLFYSDKIPIFALESMTNTTMTNRNRNILSQIKATARKSVPTGSQVLLFGSRARGEARKDSDWDILIVLPKPVLQQSDYDQVSYPLVELGWILGERINPIVYTQNEWEVNRITPFYDNVQREGISLL